MDAPGGSYWLPYASDANNTAVLQGFTVAQQCAIATKLRVMIRLWRGAATTTHLRREPSRKATFAGSGRQTRFTLAMDAAGFELDGLAAVRTLQL